MAEWAAGERAVKAVVLIGSRARAADDVVWRADAQSDWDFHIITPDLGLFGDAKWTAGLGVKLSRYVVRRAAIGGMPKVAALFDGAEADFVIIPEAPWRRARWLVRWGVHRRSKRLQRMLQDLAVVVRPGWRFLKGAKVWEPLYRRATAEIRDPRLSDDEVLSLADGFACDAVWTLRKIDRGELLAAQRMLHRSLAETNFRLLHELRLRRGGRSFPEARRAELVLGADELTAITTSARAEAAELRAAVEKGSASCRELVRALVGDSWRWPDM